MAEWKIIFLQTVKVRQIDKNTMFRVKSKHVHKLMDIIKFYMCSSIGGPYAKNNNKLFIDVDWLERTMEMFSRCSTL